MPTMLVLGATSGIARATARAFAGSGWTLQLAGRDIQRLQEVADDCGGASIFPFDALDPASRSALWGLLPSCPDAVLCAVGLLGDQDCACRDPKAALQVIECNFTGLVPVLLHGGGGFRNARFRPAHRAELGGGGARKGFELRLRFGEGGFLGVSFRPAGAALEFRGSRPDGQTGVRCHRNDRRAASSLLHRSLARARRL